MSDNHHASGHEAHAGPTHNVVKKALNLAVLLVLPVIVVGALVGHYKSQDGAPTASMSEEAVMARIQKVGVRQLGDLLSKMATTPC